MNQNSRKGIKDAGTQTLEVNFLIPGVSHQFPSVGLEALHIPRKEIMSFRMSVVCKCSNKHQFIEGWKACPQICRIALFRFCCNQLIPTLTKYK